MLILNVVRYVVAAPVEQMFVLPGLFQAMGDNPSYFNTSFTTWDFATSFFYNGVMWAVAVMAFHVMHPRLAGGSLAKSLQAFGLMWIFFAAVSAVYMNHYSHPKAFYLYNMGSAAIAFTVVALANALLYPRLVGRSSNSGAR